MKLVAVALLVLGMLGNSTLAMAEGPVPFRALMQTAGAQPSVPPITDTKDKSTTLSAQPAHTRMTSGGKIMTGTGIGMLVIGGVVLIGTAAYSGWGDSSSNKAKLYIPWRCTCRRRGYLDRFWESPAVQQSEEPLVTALQLEAARERPDVWLRVTGFSGSVCGPLGEVTK